MKGTLSMSDFEKFSNNIYEAIIVLGKRARQINSEQKIFIEKEAGIDDSYDNDDEDEFYDRAGVEEENIIKLPKPTQLAIEELIEGKLKYDYGDDVEVKKSEE